MDFSFTEEQTRFRQEVVDFCQTMPQYMRSIVDPSIDPFYSPEFYRAAASKGLIGLHWPAKYGGQGRTWIEEAIFNEERAYNGTPFGPLHYGSVSLLGDFCLAYGTEEQKREYLPRIAKGEMQVARGFTEPDAGHDLASLQTSAVADGEDYIINGQKCYSTGAHLADYIFILARTDPNVPKEEGISLFIVDMNTPGVSVSPIWTVALRTNNVFFDSVRVPGRNLIGERSRGFEYIDKDPHFRYEMDLGVYAGDTRRVFHLLIQHLKEAEDRRLAKDPLVRQKLADMAVDIQVLRWMTYRVAWMRSVGSFPNHEVFMLKLFEGESQQRMYSIASEVLGLRGQLEMGSKHAPAGGLIAVFRGYSLIATLPGSPETLRNGIASRALGLPASPG
jgi:hypothetical protein